MMVLVFSDTDGKANTGPGRLARNGRRAIGRLPSSRQPGHNTRVAQNAFRSTQSLLPNVLAKLARESGHPRALVPLWKRAAGEKIAVRTRPTALEANVLKVA